MSNQVYDVGHILFLLFERKRQVIPVQVTEQITRKTLEGEKMEYIVTLPNEKRATTELSSLGAQIFHTIEDAQEHMVTSAKLAIDSMVTKTTQIATEAFDINIKYKNTSGEIVQSKYLNNQIDEISNSTRSKTKKGPLTISSEESTKIDLGNGVIGNLKNG
jgi:arginyl-tRNA synthetase